MIYKFLRNSDLWIRRNSVHISLGVILIAFSAILILLTSATSRLAEQSAQNQQILSQLKGVVTQISENAATRTEQINGIDRHLDCIVVFFAQSDRSQKSIDDIETCALKDNSTGGVEVPKTSTKTDTNGSVTPAPSSTPEQPSTTPPVATAPPDDGFQLHDIPIVGGLLKVVGL